MPFLPPNQQRQSTEGKTKSNTSWGFSNANTDKIFAFIHRCIRTGFCSPDLDSYPDRISRITDCNFTVRMLYHNMYWLLYILDLRFVLFMYNCSLTLRNKQICYVTTKSNMHTHTHTHPFNGPLSETTQVSRYQKGKTNLDFTGARDSEWQWHQLGMCKSAPRSRQITMPEPHHSVFTSRMPFLPPNQQRQSTEGAKSNMHA